MRATYRSNSGNRDYWESRWEDIPADDAHLDHRHYPGRFVYHALGLNAGRVLEAGCGAGRVLRTVAGSGRSVVGMDFVMPPLKKLRVEDATAPLLAADIRDLPFATGEFGIVLAFGLYHNLAKGLDRALAETRRVMEPDGVLCASFRADNLQNRVIDYLSARAEKGQRRSFHKYNFRLEEFEAALESVGLRVFERHNVENMPFLYKFRLMRHVTQRRFDETRARSVGYRLAFFPRLVQKGLMMLAPREFCNVFVVFARRTQ